MNIESTESKMNRTSPLVLDDFLRIGRAATNRLVYLSDDQLKQLAEMNSDEMDDVNYIISAITESRTLSQKVIDFMSEELTNPAILKLSFKYKALWELSDMLDNEMGARGLITVINVGVNFGSRNLTITSDNGFVSRDFDPKTDTPANIMTEAAKFA